MDTTEKEMTGAGESQSQDVTVQSLQELQTSAVLERKTHGINLQERHVMELLNLAKKQMSAKRLTTPSGNNALETYRKVLRLEPENEGAKMGIQQIKKQYGKWADAAISRGDLGEGKILFKKGPHR